MESKIKYTARAVGKDDFTISPCLIGLSYEPGDGSLEAQFRHRVGSDSKCILCGGDFGTTDKEFKKVDKPGESEVEVSSGQSAGVRQNHFCCE